MHGLLFSLRGLNRNITLYLTATFFIGFTVDGGIFSVLFNLYLLRLGYGPQFIGLVAAAGLLVFTLLCLPAGMLGRRGNRRLMLIGMVLVIAGCAMIAVTEWLPADWQAAWIVAGYVVMYSGIPVYFVNGPPFLINASAPDQRSRVISVQIATWSIAAFAGSLVGGFLPGAIAQALGVSLDSPTPYRIPMMLTTFLLVIPLVCIMATREEASSQSTERVAEDGPTPVKLISVLTLVRLLQVGAIGTTSPFFNVYMDSALGVATATIGILAALGRLMAAPAALITPRLAARWGNRATIIWGSTAVALSILPLALIPTPWAAGLGYIGVIGLSSIRYSAFLTFMMNAVGPSRRAMMTGLTEASTGVSFAATSIASGYVITNYGYAPLFLAGGALSTVGTLVFWAYFRDKDVEKGVPG